MRETGTEAPHADGADLRDPLADPAFRAPGFLERLREALLGAQRPLDCLQVEVTSLCSGRCVYCPHTTAAATWRGRHMPDAVFAALWPLLRGAQRAHLLGWGEPLLHPRFLDYVALARRAGCAVSSTSCGLRMDAALARRLAESGMDLLAFSLVGTDETTNDARAGVPFARVRESVRLLRAAIRETGQPPDGEPLEIHFAYLLLADRMDAVRRLPALMDELDVEMTVVSTLDYLALPDQAHLAFAPQETEKLVAARDLLETVAAEAETRGRIIHFALPGADAVADAGGCRENVARSCYVDADGRLSPCVYLNVPDNAPPAPAQGDVDAVSRGDGRRRVFGDVRAEAPWRIWNKPEFADFRAALVRNAPDAACLGCPKRFER
ncbi:radical SAM/SPASM domain-containing protein [uncultured Desulfovibrio sp.]|uniref:radical SAM/SPASM domain-containing protein n=1 Tax=uncultured Desulfovibrio sp. TaxID=167968 RepID=UPI0026351849|nr:radical SAM protein [uncultured Desulfovibrio sp.]